MNLGMKLSNPAVYRALFVIGFLIFGAGAILESIVIIALGVIIVALSKYGMRKEHKEKLNSEIYSTKKESVPH